jgi:ribosomal protein S6
LRHFEIVAILSPMLNQDEASATWDDIKSFISNREGEITAEQVWGTRRLAYPIRKGNYNFLEGAYYLSSFTVDNAFNRELENYLRLDDRVLRSLITRCDGPLPDRPAPGPLTAPSRYIPPGRGRRSDGGGPVQDASPGGFGDRAPQPPPTGVAPGPAPTADAPAPSGGVAAAPASAADAPAPSGQVAAAPAPVADAPAPSGQVATPPSPAADAPAPSGEVAPAPAPAADPAPTSEPVAESTPEESPAVAETPPAPEPPPSAEVPAEPPPAPADEPTAEPDAEAQT